MSKGKQLDKDLALCSKCYIQLKLQCPICRLFKIKRHCKIFDNPSALHWHSKHEHNGFVSLKFSTDDEIKALNGITWALQHGMLEGN